MTSARPFSKRVAALASLSFFLLASCLLLSGAAWATPPIEQVPTGEAVLYHNFRPIVTFRGTVLGASPAVRARRSADRIDNLTPSQMVLPIELTPLTLDGVRGITVTAGGDGLKSDEDEDAGLGYILLAGGTLAVEAGADGLQAETDVLVAGGMGAYTFSESTRFNGFEPPAFVAVD